MNLGENNDMGITSMCLAFWSKIEDSLSQLVPAHAKNILHVAGYDSPITIKELNANDLVELECFAQRIPQLISNYCADKNIKIDGNQLSAIHQLFLGLYAGRPEEFKFHKGENVLILQVSNFVKIKVTRENGENDYSFFTDAASDGKASTVETSLGELFVTVSENLEPFQKLCTNNAELSTEINDDGKETSKDNVNKFENAVSSSSNQDIALDEMISCYNNNITRPANGNRYSYEMKMYAAYQRMLGGRLSYETFKSNALHAVPCLRSIDRYIAKVKSDVVEGVLRVDELLKYLTDLKLPKFVSLSEDATRITDRIQYDAGTNQLVGFVLPLNPENGMPIADYYQATSAARMERCFFDLATEKARSRSTNVIAIMAQPLKKSIPAFCLLIYGTDSMYTTADIRKRWTYIVDELQKVGIGVISFASDSDPKYNSAMRQHLSLGYGSDAPSPFPEWFNVEFSLNLKFLPVQDTVHNGTKFRNTLLNREMKIGNFTISVDHLKAVMNSFPKTDHNLCASTIAPTDRQNFESVLRICDERVIALLHEVNGSEGTILYLRVMSNILRAFLDLRLSPLERLRLIWFSNFVLRIWKQFVKSHRTYTLKDHFITNYAYTCVEINSHSLIMLILYLRDRKLEHLFHPEMFGSQQCESIFRQIRSMSSTYSTVTNSSLLEIIQKVSKIELQNEISHIKLKKFNFPRIGLPSSSYYPTIDRNGCERYNYTFQLPSDSEIIDEIELAKIEATEYAKSVGIQTHTSESFICKFPLPKQRSEIPTQTIENETESDLLRLFSEINLKEYSQKNVSGDVDPKGRFVKVRNARGDDFYVQKYTLCWLFGKSTGKLSSDRVVRSMGKRH